uniref:Uncharacterized protein n=1 Tax=Molossus molossus TaxID=27622 RepID=A0A7J8E2A4_MOLMO|nr:hypothetical protein HJG59_009009 [Molossus molossus]
MYKNRSRWREGYNHPEGPAGLCLLLAGSEPTPDVPFLAWLSHPSRTSLMLIPFPCVSVVHCTHLPSTRTQHHCTTWAPRKRAKVFLQQYLLSQARMRKQQELPTPKCLWATSLCCQQGEDNSTVVSPGKLYLTLGTPHWKGQRPPGTRSYMF